MTDNVLSKTAEIVKNGWCKGNFQKDEAHCVMGAMASAMNYTYDFYEDTFRLSGGEAHRVDHVFDCVEAKVLIETINEQYPEYHVWDHNDVYRFNDMAERTQEEIVSLLEKAAVKLEEQA